MNLKGKLVEELPLPMKTIRFLQKNNIYHLEELLTKTQDDFMMIETFPSGLKRALGRKELHDILVVMDEYQKSPVIN